MSNSILVIGDSILDHDVFCDAVGLSLETPTLKGKLTSERFLFGGAANVVEHLLALGCPVTFLTGIAIDDYCQTLLDFGKHKNLDLRPVSYEGQNLVKSRYWFNRGSGVYKTLQVNRGTKVNNKQVIWTLEKILNGSHHLHSGTSFNKAVLVDYGNGLFENEEHTQKIISILKEHNISIFSSSQKSDRDVNYKSFRGSDLICMNKYEADAATESLGLDNINSLSKSLESDLCVTTGAEGNLYYSGDELVSYKAVEVDCVDPCGAGDAFLAAMTLKEDCDFANKWAALSVTKVGTEVPKLEELDEIR